MRSPRDISTSVCSLAAGIILAALTPATAGDGGPERIRAQDFEARYVDSADRVRLSDFTGQVVLVNFWASWCYPCLVEMPEFQKLYDRFGERGFKVLAVAVYDELPDAKAFQDKYKFTFPVLFDDEDSARTAFDVKVVPQTFLVGRDGVLISIPNPKTDESKLWINDVTVWEQPETYEFLEKVVGK